MSTLDVKVLLDKAEEWLNYALVAQDDSTPTQEVVLVNTILGQAWSLIDVVTSHWDQLTEAEAQRCSALAKRENEQANACCLAQRYLPDGPLPENWRMRRE